MELWQSTNACAGTVYSNDTDSSRSYTMILYTQPQHEMWSIAVFYSQAIPVWEVYWDMLQQPCLPPSPLLYWFQSLWTAGHLIPPHQIHLHWINVHHMVVKKSLLALIMKLMCNVCIMYRSCTMEWLHPYVIYLSISFIKFAILLTAWTI